MSDIGTEDVENIRHTTDERRGDPFTPDPTVPPPIAPVKVTLRLVREVRAIMRTYRVQVNQ